MSALRITFLASVLAMLTSATAVAQHAHAHGLDSAVFVARLGADTLVVERAIRSPRRVEAEVAMRVPRTTRTMYVLELSREGMLERMQATTFGWIPRDV
jgi:hypothetical protein